MHHKICSVSYLLMLLLVSNAAHAAVTVNSTTINYASNQIDSIPSAFNFPSIGVSSDSSS